MNDFRTAYQSAVQDMDILGMKEFHIDASACMDEGRHKRRVIKQVKRVTTTAFSTVCIVFLCGFGTVTAAEYLDNVIRVNEWGFQSGDIATMTRNDTEAEEPYLVGEVIAETAEEMPGVQEGMPGPAAEPYIADMPQGTVPVADGAVGEVLMADEAVEEVQIEEVPVKNYASLEEFRKNEDIIFPQPSVSIGEKTEAVDITVCGEWAMIRYDVDGKVLWIERTDYGDTAGHASSKVFPGGVYNERSYTTPAGYTYTLVDSVKEREEEQLQIHAAITVGSYEAFVDFMGYSEAEAKNILDSIDVSQYEK